MAKKRKLTETQRWIRWAWKKSGKKQPAFAEELGVSLRTLRSWLYGESEPWKPTAKLIEYLYGRPKE